jgi:hypothetical protein
LYEGEFLSVFTQYAKFIFPPTLRGRSFENKYTGLIRIQYAIE